MMHIVLVGLDGSAGSWNAYEEALSLAAERGERVVGVLVESPLWSPPPMGRAALEHCVRARAYQLAKRHGVPFEFRVRHGYPAHTLAQQAMVLGADLVVIGHTDHMVWRRWFTPCVSALVRHEAPCAVQVVMLGTHA